MADFQDPKELEHYLKTAAELECTAYRLEKSIGAANVAEIKLEELCKVDTTRYISKPKPKKVEPPTPPEPPSKPDFMYSEVNAKIAKKIYTKSLRAIIIYCVVGAIMLCVQVAIGEIRVLLSTLALLLFVAANFRYSTEVKPNSPATQAKKKVIYEKSLLQYEEALARYEKEDLARYRCEKEAAKREPEYLKELEEYNEKVKEAKSLTERRRKKIDAAHSGISKMQNSLADVRETLKNLYAMNIVHPKYRNMVAMCSICEYFETGRCTSLKGADGAYNLYEAELRQNLIISRLDTIIDKLDDIKSGQYMLYCELKETNRILRSISSELANIASATDSIARTSSITAVCTQATAKNTEALKYIALVS